QSAFPLLHPSSDHTSTHCYPKSSPLSEVKENRSKGKGWVDVYPDGIYSQEYVYFIGIPIQPKPLGR
ncbi:MAG: hypothetical protein RLN82_10325, partial [Pseudomonadales bacterium]